MTAPKGAATKDVSGGGVGPTPGNWHTHDGNVVLTDGDGGPFLIAKMAGWMPREEMAANASVMAAAPQMLETLQELAECAPYWSEYDVPLGIVDRINAAIAKATAALSEQQS